MAVAAVLLVGSVVFLGGCAATDVVAKVAVSSFGNLVKASGEQVVFSESAGLWTIDSPEGDKVAISSDFSRSAANDIFASDIRFSLDAAPFLAAGMDPEKLVSQDGVAYSLVDSKLEIGFEIGAAKFSAPSLDKYFAQIVRTYRDRISYHEALDHYGIMLGGGNMLEWAKDLATNDKDIVWVLNPEPFASAGTDVNAIAGWIHAEVETMDAAGAKIKVWKLLRPFNLK
jgi:hypothetical protein